MKRASSLGFLFALSASVALAQSGAPVKQSGSITSGQVPWWITSGVIGGGVSSADSPVTSFGVTNNGSNGICVNSDRITAAGRNTLCLGVSTNGNGVISVQNYGTATPQSLSFIINGSPAYLPNVLNPTLGSWWSNVAPFTPNPVFKVRDRLAVDDGALIAETTLPGVLPNTRLAADMNSAGGGWPNPAGISSVYVLSSNSNTAISGQTATRLQTVPGSFSAIAVLGMALSNNPNIALPAWGGYEECARLVQNGTCFGIEVAIGNAGPDVIKQSVYGTALPGFTSGLHVNIGGALDEATHTYKNVSAAIDILSTASTGAAADRGIAFTNGSVADQGGGVFDAIVMPSSYRVEWLRNNSGADQLQAYITASNTTVGSAVQSINFGTSNLMTLIAPTVQVTGAFQSLSGASGTLGAIGVGRTISDGGFIAVATSDQVVTGTVAGDIVVESGTNLWLVVNNAISAIPVMKATTAGSTLLGAAQALSNSSGTLGVFGVGRLASEGGIVVPANANQIFTGTAPGDLVVEASTTLWLAANNAATAVPGIKIATTGLLTFPQYTTGVLRVSSGVVSALAGATCSGAPTGSFAVTGGIVTTC